MGRRKNICIVNKGYFKIYYFVSLGIIPIKELSEGNLFFYTGRHFDISVIVK